MGSRRHALAVIEARRVLVNGAPALKATRLVDPGDDVVVDAEPPRYVSRGGLKLEAALAGFHLDVSGWRVLDAGASTGGFTDCLLQHGAAEVVAVDVGHGQLHPRLRADPRVRVVERCNVRHLRADDCGGLVDAVVADLSFISLTLVVPALVGVARPGAHLVLLVKPQFEVGRREASRGRGVITDPQLRSRACEVVEQALVAAGAKVLGRFASPLLGAAGNQELFLHARVGS